MRDGPESCAGDPGASSRIVKTIATMTPAPARSFRVVEAEPGTGSAWPLQRNMRKAQRQVYANANVNPIDAISTIQLRAVRPNQGATRQTARTNQIPVLGVPCLG